MTEPSFEDKHTYILEWFNRVILGYLCRDIEKLLPITPDDDGFGGCAAPLAMTVFSTIDRLGYLTKKDDKDLRSTERHVKDFCAEWMVKVNPNAYGKGKTRDLLAEIFRHGLTHQFISSYGTAIVKKAVSGDVVGKDPVSETYILQVDILAEDLLETIKDQLAKDLANPDKKKLILNFYDRLRSRQQDDERNLVAMQERLKKKRERDYEIPILGMDAFPFLPTT